jgi:hypothetical protein
MPPHGVKSTMLLNSRRLIVTFELNHSVLESATRVSGLDGPPTLGTETETWRCEKGSWIGVPLMESLFTVDSVGAVPDQTTALP